MDALKKAEQEKREAARKLEQAGGVPLIDPGSVTDRHATPPVEDPTIARPLELSLEPVSGEFAAQPAAGPAPPEGATEAAPLPGTGITGGHPYALELDAGEPEAGSAPAPAASGLAHELAAQEAFDGDRTFHGLDARTATPVAVPGMFEETVAGDMAVEEEGKGYDETLPGVSAVQLARDIGTRDQPTPVAAETVFVAGAGREGSGAAVKWVLGGLTAVMLVAAGLWYYLSVTPVVRNVPSPWVARGIESVPALRGDAAPVVPGELPGAVPVPEAIAEGVPVSEADALAAGAAPATPMEPVAATEPAPVTPAGTDMTAAAEPGAPPETPAVAAPAPGPVPDTAVPARAQAATAVTAPALTAPSLVRVSRAAEPSPAERMVREAYDLYQAGDLAGARSMYAAVLQDYPDNIDALLGIGAIALRSGDTATAVETHGRVLRLEPGNATALAVLVGLNRSADPNTAESALNSLIRQSPDQPFLYYTLGNVYAAQQRWAEAQQAYFDAHRTDTANPDYAYNLAVSLDRLGQRQAALDFYNTALRLAEAAPAGFDPSVVLARVQALTVGTTP
jgi:Flp pilus assembly protein TadD